MTAGPGQPRVILTTIGDEGEYLAQGTEDVDMAWAAFLVDHREEYHGEAEDDPDYQPPRRELYSLRAGWFRKRPALPHEADEGYTWYLVRADGPGRGVFRAVYIGWDYSRPFQAREAS